MNSSSIYLYNSYSRKIEKFKSLHQKEVTMYVCGVTPYDTSHLGHAFVFTVFDTLVRLLRYKGFSVNYTQNVTDIDDPLLEKAKQLNVPWQQLVDQWISYLLHDFQYLNIDMPTHYVKATEEVPTMLKIITVLIEKGYGYIKNGNVYFEIKKFPRYGQLSKLDRESMIKISSEMGNDIHDPYKKDPLDFVLWKKSLPDEPSWESPWSLGRPGWHIECTAMSMKYLGEQIDIHGGGADILFPHHESEIAQSEGYSGKSPFVKIWMHCALVKYKGTKMSKSLGNLVYVQDLAKKYSANAIRYYLLSHHYRSEWEYNEQEMKKASKEMKVIEKNIKLSDTKKTDEGIDLLLHDLNTPAALEHLYANSQKGSQASKLFNVLGFKI